MKYCVMFHHFHDDNTYPNLQGGGSISAIDFHSIIDYIDENYNLITPDEYIQKVVNKSIKEFDVCLTFDDNLKSQFDILYPELEKRKLKAFFFVYSGAFSENPPMLEFFRDFRLNFFRNLDEYYELFFETIRSNYSKEYNTFLKNYKPDYLSSITSFLGANFYTINDKKYRFLRDFVLHDKYFDVVLNLMKEKNYSFSSRKEFLFMSTEEIKTLHNSGHLIGLHSHSHPTKIQSLSYKNQLEEYTKNYEFINAITNEKVSSMSHPCGNYNTDTIKILKKLGIKVGFRSSLVPSIIKSALEIPRESHSNVINEIRKIENNSFYK